MANHKTDIVATQRLSAPQDESAEHRAQIESSLLDTAARDTGRPGDQLAMLTLEGEALIKGALFRVDVERGTLITVDDPRSLQHGTSP